MREGRREIGLRERGNGREKRKGKIEKKDKCIFEIIFYSLSFD